MIQVSDNAGCNGGLVLTYLAPLYIVCMIGSIIIVKKSERKAGLTMEDITAGLRRIEELSSQDNYCEALKETEKLLLKHPYFIAMLIHKARLIQLAGEDCDVFDNYTLDDAKQALELATRLDPYSAEAFSELGHFTYVHEDDDEAALKLFNKSIELGLHELDDAYLGKVGAVEAIGIKEDYDRAMEEQDIIGELLERIQDENSEDES